MLIEADGDLNLIAVGSQTQWDMEINCGVFKNGLFEYLIEDYWHISSRRYKLKLCIVKQRQLADEHLELRIPSGYINDTACIWLENMHGYLLGILYF